MGPYGFILLYLTQDHACPKAPKMNLAKEDAKWNAYKTVENRLRAPHLRGKCDMLMKFVELAVGES